jgi:tetratricopeptide (TPR) repeat protein
MKKKYTYLIIIFLIVVSCAAFGRIAGNYFINLDDPGYITNNYHVQSAFNLKNIEWAFTSVVMYNWHPLTLLSHMLDWSLFGANASGHHIISLLLHIGAVIFLFLFLNKTTNNLWPSAFAAALFALHPLRVESVAWAAERKDVLSMFFGMACLYTYAFYAEKTKISRYILCLILFALALMSKPMLVTLPFVLLLLDYWPLGRWQKAVDPVKVPIAATERAEKKKTKKSKADSIKEKIISVPVKSSSHLIGRLLWEKTPFVFLTIASSIITFWAQNKEGSVTSADFLPFITRSSNAIVSYVAYLGKIFLPFNLAIFYPYEFSLPLWKILVSCLILIVITTVIIYYIKKLPFLFVGWFWYLGTLVPVIGLVQVGSQAMADRYAYLPSIGIAVMLSWGIPLLFLHKDIRKKILFPVSIVILFALAILTWTQCGYWKNSFTLFSHALQVTKNNYLAHTNRGAAYAELGQYQRAIQDYNEAIHLKPDDSLAFFNRAATYHKLGQYQNAINDYNEAIRLRPDYADAYYNRGIYYARDLGQYPRAIEDFNEAIRLKPDSAEVYKNRGVAYFKQGNNNLGCSDLQKACEMGDCKLLELTKGKGLCR